MIHKLFSFLVILALVGCGAHHQHHKLHHQKKCSPAADPGASTVTLEGHCAGASLLVVPEKGAFQYGLDPVETHQGILQSRAFRASLAKSRPSMSKVNYAVRRAGKSALLKVVVSHSAEADAVQACEALIQLALTHDDPSTLGDDTATSWLKAQRKILEERMKQAEEKLHAFKKEHGLVVLSLSDRMSLSQDRLKDLHKARDKTANSKRRREMEKAIDSIREEMLRYNMLEIEEKRLVREVSSAEHMLQAVVNRTSVASSERMFDRRIRLLDRCAPVACR
jgi:hypothetical protein